MKLKTSIALILTSALLGGCATSNCAGWREVGPVTLSPQDKLTEKTERKVVAINEFGEKQGCWSPPKDGALGGIFGR